MASWHEDRQRATHAVAVRLSTSEEASAYIDELRSRIGPDAVWRQKLHYVPGSTGASRWRAAEMRRPVRAGAHIRAVIADLADDTSEVVLAADRACVTFTDLLQLGTANTHMPKDCGSCSRGETRWAAPAHAPEWGLPKATNTTAATIHLTCDEDLWEDDAAWVSALAITLRWFDPESMTAAQLTNASTGETLHLGVQSVDPNAPIAHVFHSADVSRRAPAAKQPALAGIVTADLRGAASNIADWSPFADPPYPMTFVLTRWQDGHLDLAAHVQRDAFAGATVKQFSDDLMRVRRQIQSQPNLCISALEAELAPQTPLERAPRRAAGADARPRLEERFAYWAHRTPDAIAVTDRASQLTYAKLDARAERIARGLRNRGAQDGTFVGICLSRSVDLIATMLGVLKTGAAYVPVDPRYPHHRLLATFDDASVGVIVTDEHWPGESPDPRSVTVADLLMSPTVDGARVGAGSGPDAAAYVIYTSGSTGRPKGVVVSHNNVESLFDAVSEGFRFTSEDIWSCFHSVAFDFSVWEIWGALLTGAKLVLVPYWVARTPTDFLALLREECVTILSQTPSAFTQFVHADEGGELAVRLVILGGEALKAPAVLTWLDRHPEDECTVVNMYGITETTVHVTWQKISRRQAIDSPACVGTPIPGWTVTIRDAAGHIRPLGSRGEIVVGGAGVAQGYLNRPDLTSDRFYTDPGSGQRLYRSGDQGRMLLDGTIEHLGRLDNQIKLRGFRIELDEIRSAILRQPGIVDAHVAVRSAPDGDETTAHIVAYAVSTSGAAADSLRRALAQTLPEHMVPSTVFLVPELPLTPNGKVDGQALFELPAVNGREEAIPNSIDSEGTQAALIQLWSELFTTPATATSDFFDLGGNSLLAVRLAALMQDRGLPPLQMRELYLHPTPGTLARVLDGGTRS
jgi:amino acid adenylation domain-containing protein